MNKRRRVRGCLALLVTAMMLMSCKTLHVQPKTPNYLPQMHNVAQNAYQTDKQLDKQHQQLPDSVNRALLPGVKGGAPNQDEPLAKSQHRFDVVVKDAPVKSFFLGLVKDTPYNIVLSPELGGKITLNLKNVTVPEVLDAVRDNYGFQYEKMPYGYQILDPSHVETRIFTINYLNVRRAGNSKTMVSSGDISSKIGANGSTTNEGGGTMATSSAPTISALSSLTAGAGGGEKPTQYNQNNVTLDNGSSSAVQTQSTTDFWSELNRTLKTLVGNKDGASVVVNSEAGLVIVKAYPKSMRTVSKYLESMQNIMLRQVIIDAKILEVQLNSHYDAGVDWNIFGAKQQGTLDFPTAGIAGLKSAFTASIFTLKASNRGAFSMVLRLLRSQGDVQILSSPRIATLNNQKAVIKVGKDQFFVTNFQTSTLASTGGTDQTENIEMTPFFSGIALDVTPEVDQHHNVTLHIHPIVSRVTDDKKQIDLGTSKGVITLPMAISTVRESDSIVRAKNGQVVVIGGLMERNADNGVAKAPGLASLPIVGAAFKRTTQSDGKTELVILLRPIVVMPGTWSEDLHGVSKAMSHYRWDAQVAPHS